ncbi:MAG: sugar ABC transporter substrate-binding protein [candidate division NC10 bacterium]|nr:sugar ABC transporter substrate-binding protein [candidate division NC10 bacterium]
MKTLSTALVLVVSVLASMIGTPGDAANVTLEVQYGLPTVEAQTVFKRFVADFERANPDIKIELSLVPMDKFLPVSAPKFMAGTAPDIVHALVGSGIEIFRNQGALYDLSAFMDADFRSSFVPQFWGTLGTHALPISVQLEGLIFYRTDKFKKAGVIPPAGDTPWTWDEFLAAAKKLTKDVNGDGVIDEWGFAERGMLGFRFTKASIPYYRAAGTDVIRQNGKGKWVSTFDTSETQKALRFQVDLMTKHQVRPKASITWGSPEGYRAWKEGAIAMFNIGSYYEWTIRTMTPDLQFADGWDVMLFPVANKSIQPSILLQEEGFAITRQSKHPQEAWRFLKFLYTKDRLKELAIVNTEAIPALKDSLNLPYYTQQKQLWVQKLSKWMKYVSPQVSHPKYVPIWSNIIGPITQEIMGGKMDVEPGAREMHGRINRDLQ